MAWVPTQSRQRTQRRFATETLRHREHSCSYKTNLRVSVSLWLIPSVSSCDLCVLGSEERLVQTHHRMRHVRVT